MLLLLEELFATDWSKLDAEMLLLNELNELLGLGKTGGGPVLFELVVVVSEEEEDGPKDVELVRVVEDKPPAPPLFLEKEARCKGSCCLVLTLLVAP